MPLSVFGGAAAMTKSAKWSTVSSSKVGTFSMWIDLASDGADKLLLSSTISSGAQDTIGLLAANYFYVRLWNDGSSTLGLYLVTATTTITAAKGVQHIIASWDIGANAYAIYIDGVAQEFSAETRNDVAAGWGQCDNLEVMRQNTNFTPASIGDYWCDLGVYIDLTSATNREKFRSSGGKPVFLGADGSIPTGSAPDAFFSGDHDAFHTNKGGGGGMTEVGTIGDGGFYPA